MAKTVRDTLEMLEFCFPFFSIWSVKFILWRSLVIVLLVELSDQRAGAARYVHEGFDYEQSFIWGTGYGLVDFWNPADFDSYSMDKFKVKPNSLDGLGTIDSAHLEREDRGDMATIYRELAEPIGTPETTKYLGCLLRIPVTGQLTPRGIYFGIELRGHGRSVYMGGVNSVGPKLMLSAYPGSGGAEIAESMMEEGTTYFCVLKMEFEASSTTGSLYIGGDESQAPDAVLMIRSGLLTTLDVTGNYPFSIDEIRIADSIQELRRPPDQAAPPLSAEGQTVKEGNSGNMNVVITARLEYASEYDAYLDFWTLEETATAEDFVGQRERVHFPPGEVAKQITVPIIGDLSFEPDESFRVMFSRLGGIASSSTTRNGVVVTIQNDDVEPVEVRLEIAAIGGKLVLSWNSSPQSMPLQQSTDLMHWENVQPALLSSDNSGLELEFSGSQRFYRFAEQQ